MPRKSIDKRKKDGYNEKRKALWLCPAITGGEIKGSEVIMPAKIVELYQKYKEVFWYLVFGVLTTMVNFITYYPLRFLGVHYLAATALAWFVSVLFAYITNRRWVFASQATGLKNILKEAGLFFGGRLFSGGVDMALMAVFVDWIGWSDKIVKVPVNVLVIVLNYVLSKLIVFRRGKEEK